MAYLTLSDEMIQKTLDQGEFPETVRKTAEKVVVILTQDWCPDWHAMDAFLPQFTDQAAIFVLEYNKHPEFERIMEFKEETFDNREIPYIRYYRNGELITATNVLPKGTFAALLQKSKPFKVV